MKPLNDIANIENDRQAKEKLNIIHMYNSGGGWWKAYEWSAWLIKTFSYTEEVRAKTKDKRKLQVQLIDDKENGGKFYAVGFMTDSLDKFIPNRQNYEMRENNELFMTIELPKNSDNTEMTYEQMKKEFEEWKKTVPAKANETKNTERVQTLQTPVRLTDIMTEILRWQIEQKTPMENIQFISDIKAKLTLLI